MELDQEFRTRRGDGFENHYYFSNAPYYIFRGKLLCVVVIFSSRVQ